MITTMSSILITTFLNPRVLYCIAQFQIHSRYSSNYSLKHIDTVRFTECIDYGKGKTFIQRKNTYKYNYLYQSSVSREGWRHQIRLILGKSSKWLSTPPSFFENYVAIFYDRYGCIYARRYDGQIVWNAGTWFPFLPDSYSVHITKYTRLMIIFCSLQLFCKK